MLTPTSQLMPSLLRELNRPNMTILESDFYEAPCRNRCGEMIPCRWEEQFDKTGQWVYERECYGCSEKRSAIQRHEQALRSSGLTEREQGLTLDSFKVDENNRLAYEAAKRMSMGYSINLFLYGSAGRGKTHLATGVILAMLDDVHKTKFFPITKGLMNVRSNLRETTEEEYVNRLLSYDVLVLDDFGANKLTEWNLSFMDCLFDEWYRQDRAGLIITSNFSIKEVAERISDRIASRIAGMCEIHELKGKDHRIN
jgi:DNA replication protein DnaC